MGVIANTGLGIVKKAVGLDSGFKSLVGIAKGVNPKLTEAAELMVSKKISKLSKEYGMAPMLNKAIEQEKGNSVIQGIQSVFKNKKGGMDTWNVDAFSAIKVNKNF